MKQAVDKLLRVAPAVGAALFASACDLRNSAVLDPKGPIALAERDLLRDAFLVMMVVIVPVIFLTLPRLQYPGRLCAQMG